MENLTILKRLNSQIDSMLGALQAAREEIGGLQRELSQCRAERDEKQQQVQFLQDTIAQSDAEMEQLVARIASVLEGAAHETEQPAYQQY